MSAWKITTNYTLRDQLVEYGIGDNIAEFQVYDDGDWITIPFRSFEVKDSGRNPVTQLNLEITSNMLTQEQSDLLTLYKRINFFHVVAGEDFSFEGLIVADPRSLLTKQTSHITVTCYDETYNASRYRFVDSWPKPGIETYSEIIVDAWTRYYPHEITFNGVETHEGIPDAIFNPWNTLYEFMEDICQRTGWRWKVANNDLKYYDPTKQISDIEIGEVNIRPGTMINEGQPEIANVVYVTAQYGIENFEDNQDTVSGRQQYFLQYPPRKGHGVVEDYFKPEIYVNGVQIPAENIAKDGSVEAETADVVYNLENRFIRFASGKEPSGGLQLKVIYDATIPVLVERKHPTSIRRFGRIDHIIRKIPRPSREEAAEIGDAYLSTHAIPVTAIQAELLEKRVRCGWYYQVSIPSRNIDQLMPVESIIRTGNQDGSYTVVATFQQAAVSDRDLIFDIFRRLEHIEAKETLIDERLERDLNIEDTWKWANDIQAFWSDVERPADNHGLKHHARYIFEQVGGRFIYPS